MNTHMKLPLSFYAATAAMALVAGAALAQAHPAQAIPPVRDASGNPVTAQTMGQQVRVMLPGGEMISLPDSPAEPWWKENRVVGYDRYVFDPGHNAYRVYSDSDWTAYAGKWGGASAGEGNRRQSGTEMPSGGGMGGDANGIKWHDSRDTMGQ